jgi:hypothetical protein
MQHTKIDCDIQMYRIYLTLQVIMDGFTMDLGWQGLLWGGEDGFTMVSITLPWCNHPNHGKLG